MDALQLADFRKKHHWSEQQDTWRDVLFDEYIDEMNRREHEQRNGEK